MGPPSRKAVVLDPAVLLVPSPEGAVEPGEVPVVEDVAEVEHIVQAPRASAGWTVITVPGGWLRYNATQGKIDAHCGQGHAFGKNCKMDRGLAKGPSGLHMAWLSKIEVEVSISKSLL